MPIIKISCAVVYFWSEHIYAYIKCSGIDPTNVYFMSVLNTCVCYV